MAGRYRARVDIRRTIVLLPHSATTLGGEETLPTRSRRTDCCEDCRLNSKRTQFSKIVVVFIQ
jgi:hypothetical protein